MAYLFENISPVEVIDTLLAEALAKRVSDIHIKPEPRGLVVKFRIDGLLAEQEIIPLDQANQIVARLKVLARLRTDEHNLPQDGRFPHFAKASRGEPHSEFDVRIAVTPTHFGEAAVLRLLVKNQQHENLADLGFTDQHVEIILKNLKRPSGLILVTGPTGSGKTTTLYSCLKEISRPEIAITTIEDPIEYALPGITQIPVNHHAGLTFANGLRSIVRQDPDVIMVGEIRDADTAKIAINAALTGHLVLSTLHTNDAPGALPRLIDMGIDPYLIGATVTLVIGQRLVRLIDGDQPTSGESGRFSGRSVIAEVLKITEPVRQAILDRAGGSAIADLASQNGFAKMSHHGEKLVAAGRTTAQELARVIYD